MTTPVRPDHADPAKAHLGGRRVAGDLLIAVILLACSGMWATSFWHTYVGRVGQGVFYQTYFEPAVMVACGKGFVISNVQPKPLEDFLFQRRDALECSDIPAETQLGTRYLYQGAWTYLLVTVGLSWRVLGISWSGMGPIFGLAFGTVIALAYGIFRLGMGRVLAVASAIFLAVSSTHLLNLPHLRDYAKAPFTLALVLLLGLLVTLPVRRWVVVGLSIACGAVLGVGYGFRTDFLVNLPAPIVVLFAFLAGGVTRNLWLKMAGAILFVATFVAVSWPITSTVYTSGGCQWHVTMLGLQSPFDGYLRITPAPYDFGHAYSDSYIDRVVNGYRWRHDPGTPPLVSCSHDYDVESGQYLRAIVAGFPADMITRSYASVLQIVNLPGRSAAPPMADWRPAVFTARGWVVDRAHRWGFWVATTAILLTGAASVRLALSLVFFVVYFGGYPAIQFQERHYFHLEFIGWFAIGFVLQQAATAAAGLKSEWPDASTLMKGAARSAVVAAVAAALLGGVQGAARWYQERQVRELLQAYISAPKTPVVSPGEALPGIGPSEWPQLLEVELNVATCGDKPAVTLQYDKAEVGLDFTQTVTVDRPSSMPGPTRIFVPVFEKYVGLDLAGAGPGCLTGVSRVTDVRPFPLLLGAMLPPDWESLPLHQRLIDWE